jgi:Iron-sulfur cluster assembly protein
LTANIVAALKTGHDPEIPADIYELGLIYKIDIDDDRNVAIVMTLTAPGCPVAGEMPQWVENAVASVTGVGEGHAHLRPAVGQGSHDGRSKTHAQYVLTAHLGALAFEPKRANSPPPVIAA